MQLYDPVQEAYRILYEALNGKETDYQAAMIAWRKLLAISARLWNEVGDESGESLLEGRLHRMGCGQRRRSEVAPNRDRYPTRINRY